MVNSHTCVSRAAQGMVNRKGSAATMMSALANADINIKAIAQVGDGCGGAGQGGPGHRVGLKRNPSTPVSYY